VRGQLGGGTAPLPLPGDATSFASNWSGDIVAYVPQGTGPSTDWGVWRLRANETTWHWLGSVPAPADATLTLPSNGTPMLCFVEATTNRPTLARFAEGVPPDVHSAQSGSESVALVRATADESGHWQLLWVESDSVTNTVRRIRQEPGQAVTAAADILTFGPAGMPYMQSIRTSTRGAAIIHGGVSFVSSLLNCAGNTNETARVVRVEADGSLGAIEFLPIAAGAEVIDGISPERGEWMCFQHTICGNFVRQNTARPGGPLEANPTFLFGTFDLSKIVWAVNDSGQALLVAQAQYGPVLALLLD
jgi:hypothetical protein